MNLQTLRERQQWTLQQKIDHSLGVIEAFNTHFDGQVFVSFSGGKDSCVMLSLVEMVLPQVLVHLAVVPVLPAVAAASVVVFR